MSSIPKAHFGDVDEDAAPVDWRALLAGWPDAPDDDEELADTPQDVVWMLGFDPLEPEEGEA